MPNSLASSSKMTFIQSEASPVASLTTTARSHFCCCYKSEHSVFIPAVSSYMMFVVLQWPSIVQAIQLHNIQLFVLHRKLLPSVLLFQLFLLLVRSLPVGSTYVCSKQLSLTPECCKSTISAF